MTTYLITAKNLFSATMLINNIKENHKTNPECKFIIHTPLFMEVNYRYIEYSSLRKLLKEHATKVICKMRLKNSTKYIKVEL